MIFGYLISARIMKTLSDLKKFVDNFRYDLDENNCLRAQIIRKGLVIYMYMKITNKNIMECVEMVASLAAKSYLNMQAICQNWIF